MAARGGRRNWKAGVLKPQGESSRIKRETSLRGEYARQRMEHVRPLAELCAQTSKEEQNVQSIKGSLITRLQEDEMTHADFENDIKDTKAALEENRTVLNALKKAGVK